MQKHTALDKVEFEIFLLSPDYSPKNIYTQLYHYTRDDVKQQIVHGKELHFRLSRTNTFLDQNEGTAILEPYYHACGHLYETEEIDHDFFIIARGIGREALQNHKSDLWALCLTPHGQSAFMKERYAAKDGWIISFCSGALDDVSLYFPTEYGRFERIEIQYSFKKMKRLMESQLKKIFKAYKKDMNHGVPDLSAKVRDLLMRVVYRYGLRYKGKDYREEKEERLLFYLKAKEQPFEWEPFEKTVEVKYDYEEGEETVYLILKPPCFYNATQELSTYNDERLNGFILNAETIRKVLNEKK